MPAVIRPMGPQDWPLHREARLRALADSPDAFGATLAEAEARSPEAWAGRLAEAAVSGRDYPLLAQVDGAIGGLAWTQIDQADPTLAEVFQVWVAPQYRGQGIARQLLDAAIGWARAKGVLAVRLDVTCGDTAAVRLYRRAGFVEVGSPAPFRAGSPLLAQVMRLDLPPSAASSVPL